MLSTRLAQLKAPAVWIVVSAALGVPLVGCGSSSSSSTSTTNTTPQSRAVDTATVESGIKQQLSTPTAQVTGVKCPNDVKSEVGASFECSVTWNNGATGKVKVTETTLTHYTYGTVPGSVQVPGSTAEKSLQEQLAKQGAPNAQVSCPNNIIVKVGTNVTCNVSGAKGNATGTVSFTFSDAEGTIDSSSVKST